MSRNNYRLLEDTSNTPYSMLMKKDVEKIVKVDKTSKTNLDEILYEYIKENSEVESEYKRRKFKLKLVKYLSTRYTTAN